MTRRVASILLYVATLFALSYLLFVADVQRITLVGFCFAVGVAFSMLQDEIEHRYESRNDERENAVARFTEFGHVPMCPINDVPQSKCQSCIEDKIIAQGKTR